MSMKPGPIGPIPAETERVARAAFPRGNRAMQMRDRLGGIYDDARFADLFAARGRPAETPGRLAVVTVLQFAEGLSDCQAADAVRGRIDWKYLLGLTLEDPGFDFSVLSEFRTRLVASNAEHLLLDTLLATCTAHGLLRARGRQRTDSTHVLGSLRALNRLEQVAETVRAALEAVAEADPAWLQAHAPTEWFVRYQRRIEDYRLPQGQVARADFACQVGEDGMALITAVFAPDAPPSLRTLGAVEILRRTWIQRYLVWEGEVRLREPSDQPPASDQIVSPYETDARYATKRATSWVGYKSHLTETCDDDLPRPVSYRLGNPGRHLSPGPPKYALAEPPRRAPSRPDPRRIRACGLFRLPGPASLHPLPDPSADPHAAPARRTRRPPPTTAVADHCRVPRPLWAARRHRRDDLPGRSGVRSAPSPLSRPGQDASPACGNRRRNRP